MIVKAIKMHGQGNDYVFLDLEDVTYSHDQIDWASLAIKLSDRHFGIGGDGLVLIEKSFVEDNSCHANMRIFNIDGSEAETCGTALRCTAYYLSQKRNYNQVKIQTLSGIKECIVDLENAMVSVNMGKVILERTFEMFINGIELTGFFVNVGNPHFVVFDDLLFFQEDNVWQKIENHVHFPNRTNVECVLLINQNEISIKIWERGSGFTLACGSGACASAFIAHKEKNLSNKIKVCVPGGDLFIEIKEDDSCILSGTATKVFETEINIKE